MMVRPFLSLCFTVFAALLAHASGSAAAEQVDLRQLKLGLLQKLRSSMWEKIIEKEAELQELNTTIPEKEEAIVLTKALQAELRLNLTKAATCRLIGASTVSGESNDGTLECKVPGKHVLWNGLGKLLLGSSKDSAFSFLTLSYMPFDATLLGSTLIAFVGFGYGAFIYKMITAS